MEDHFATLGVPETATTEEITRAYRRLCHLYHPDKFGGDVTSSMEMMTKVNAAYRVLRDHDGREAHLDHLRTARAARARAREARRQSRSQEQPRSERAAPNTENMFARPAQPTRTGIDPATALKWTVVFLIAVVALWLLFGVLAAIVAALIAVVKAIIAAIAALLGALFWIFVVLVVIVVLGMLVS